MPCGVFACLGDYCYVRRHRRLGGSFLPSLLVDRCCAASCRVVADVGESEGAADGVPFRNGQQNKSLHPYHRPPSDVSCRNDYPNVTECCDTSTVGACTIAGHPIR